MKDQNRKFSPGLHKPLQLWKSWSKLRDNKISWTKYMPVESWILIADLGKRTQAFDMRCCRSYWTFRIVTYLLLNEDVHRKTNRSLETMLNSWPWSRKGNLGGLSTSQCLLARRTILRGIVKGKWWRGRQRKRWEDTVKYYLETVMDIASWIKAQLKTSLVGKYFCKAVCGAPSTMHVMR